MAAAAVSLPFVDSYPCTSVEQLPALAELLNDIDIVPTPGAYQAFADRVSERGVAVANGCVAAGPMHLLLHDLMPMDLFFYAYHDARDCLREFCRTVSSFFERIVQAMVSSDAPVVLYGGNFDRDLIWPPSFRDEIVPHLREVSTRLHAAGKLLLCHTDGENAGLTADYREASIRLAESVCPAPMSSFGLDELRAERGPEICL